MVKQVLILKLFIMGLILPMLISVLQVHNDLLSVEIKSKALNILNY